METRWLEGVGWGLVTLPVGVSGLVAVLGLAVVEDALVGAGPGVGLNGEGVVLVGGPLVVSVDLV